MGNLNASDRESAWRKLHVPRPSWAERLAALPQLPPEPEPVVCPDCDNVGWVVITYHRNGVFDHHERADCPNPTCPARLALEAERQQVLLKQAQLPSGYAQMTFTQWDDLVRDYPDYMQGKWDALGAARAFVAASGDDYYFSLAQAAAAVNLDPDDNENDARNSLVFSGINGVGKTSLASCIANAVLSAQRPVLYARTMDFFEAVKQHFNNEQSSEFEYQWGETQQAVVQTFQKTPLLILDEFNMKQYTDWRLDKMEEVVRYRYSHQLPTVFTTNLTYDDLVAYWRPQIGHAIHGMAHWVRMGGYELRRRNGEKVSR